MHGDTKCWWNTKTNPNVKSGVSGCMTSSEQRWSDGTKAKVGREDSELLLGLERPEKGFGGRVPHNTQEQLRCK